jgi:hypothetical protein
MFLFDDIDFIQTQSLPLNDLWYFLPIGYLFTILIETPVLVVGLPRKISLKQKLLCGVWLTACTYPIVILVLPAIFLGEPRWIYLTIAEIFAPLAECLLFFVVFRNNRALSSRAMVFCLAVIVIANLASFAGGEVLNYYGWFGLF